MNEFENENKQLNFLDAAITNTVNNSSDFKIVWKRSITNVKIKPNSDIAPNIVRGVFEGFYHEHTKYVLKGSPK